MTFIIGTPHTRNAGYFRNDDSPSGGKLEEADIQTCPHCQAIINLQKWKQAPVQNFCNRCMKPTCDNPNCVHECLPWLQKLEQEFDATVKYEKFLKDAGLTPHIPQSLILKR